MRQTSRWDVTCQQEAPCIIRQTFRQDFLLPKAESSDPSRDCTAVKTASCMQRKSCILRQTARLVNWNRILHSGFYVKYRLRWSQNYVQEENKRLFKSTGDTQNSTSYSRTAVRKFRFECKYHIRWYMIHKKCNIYMIHVVKYIYNTLHGNAESHKPFTYCYPQI